MTHIRSMNTRRISLIPALFLVVFFSVALFSGSAYAQNEVKSTDLSRALKVFLDNMSAAQSSEQATLLQGHGTH